MLVEYLLYPKFPSQIPGPSSSHDIPGHMSLDSGAWSDFTFPLCLWPNLVDRGQGGLRQPGMREEHLPSGFHQDWLDAGSGARLPYPGSATS